MIGVADFLTKILKFQGQTSFVRILRSLLTQCLLTNRSNYVLDQSIYRSKQFLILGIVKTRYFSLGLCHKLDVAMKFLIEIGCFLKHHLVFNISE